MFPNRWGNCIKDSFLSQLLKALKIAAVPHGFRSSFRDWAAERTDHPREVIEAALAHVIQNKVEAAYARSDLFEWRRQLMDDYMDAGPPISTTSTDPTTRRAPDIVPRLPEWEVDVCVSTEHLPSPESRSAISFLSRLNQLSAASAATTVRRLPDSLEARDQVQQSLLPHCLNNLVEEVPVVEFLVSFP